MRKTSAFLNPLVTLQQWITADIKKALTNWLPFPLNPLFHRTNTFRQILYDANPAIQAKFGKKYGGGMPP
jgi:hypothetical protein